MLEKLPVGEFEYCTLTLYDTKSYNPDSDYGFFVEVDDHIPGELHDYLKDLHQCLHRIGRSGTIIHFRKVFLKNRVLDTYEPYLNCVTSALTSCKMSTAWKPGHFQLVVVV